MMKYTYRFFSILLLSIISSAYCNGQISAKMESELVAGNGDHTPFWIMSNKHGVSSADLNNGYVRLGVFRGYDENKTVQYRFGLDFVKANNFTSRQFIQQAYFDVQFNKKYEFSFGSKEIPSLFKNQELSSGSMTWSGNARPIPMAKFSTNDFISYDWLFNRILKFKATSAFGWFTDGDFQASRVRFDPTIPYTGFTNFYTKNALYHHKELYIKFDIPNFPWTLYGGVEMKVQFDGDKYYMNDGKLVVNHTPTSFNHFLMALIPMRGDKDSPNGDKQFIFGNTLGSIHINLQYTQPKYFCKFYLDNFFEDYGGMAKKNGLDGLWGVEYSNTTKHGITGIVAEYLQTTNQGGAIHWAPTDYPGVKLTNDATGNDDYYNNGNFTGWEHWGMTNGNPLLSSPIYNTDGSMRIENNRVKAYHLGISARYNDVLNGRILATYSDGWGRHYQPFLSIKSNFSLLTEVNYTPKKLERWKFTTAFGLDRGDLYGNNQAISLKASYTFKQ